MQTKPPSNFDTQPADETVFVNAAFLAKRWGVTRPSIYNWAIEKRIPSVRIGSTVRFPLAQTLAAVEGAASR